MSVLPEWLQRGADVIPMTHALEALWILLLMNGSMASIAASLLALGLWAVVALPLSLYAFRYAPKVGEDPGNPWALLKNRPWR